MMFYFLRPLGEQRVNELLCIKFNQIFDAFAQANQLHGNSELSLDCEHDATLG